MQKGETIKIIRCRAYPAGHYRKTLYYRHFPTLKKADNFAQKVSAETNGEVGVSNQLVRTVPLTEVGVLRLLDELANYQPFAFTKAPAGSADSAKSQKRR